jgi:prepilin-type processing-associated H-X9-DG protein
MFASENKGRMPTQAGSDVYYYNTAGAPVRTSSATAVEIKSPADWIAWRRIKDPIDGTRITSNPNQNITYSALAKYLGSRYTETTGEDEANQANTKLDEVYRCPSDVLEARPNKMNDKGAYRYSYSMNRWYAGNNPGTRGEANDGAGKTTDTSNFTGKISSIRKSGEKILFVCEDEQTIDDGVFNPNTTAWVQPGGKINAVAARHTNRRARANNQTLQNIGNENAKGNVAFADGHVEFFSRKDALRQVHTGNPAADDPRFK